MPNAISMFLVFAAFASSLACTRPDPLEAWSGSLVLSVCASEAGGDTQPARLSITRLDEPFDTRNLLLPSDRGSVAVELSAGLYAVDGVPGSSAADAVDAVVPVQSKPVLVVVAPGQVSTVYVHITEAGTLGAPRVLALGER